MKQIDMKEHLPKMLLGASLSVDLLTVTGFNFAHGHPVVESAALVDRRISRRCILTKPQIWLSTPHSQPAYDHIEESLVKDIIELGWHVRVINKILTFNCVIIDSERAILSEPTHSPDSYFYIEGIKQLRTVVEHFDRLWNGYGSLVLLYEDVLGSSLPDVSKKVVVASNERWKELIEYFTRFPNEMHHPTPGEV